MMNMRRKITALWAKAEGHRRMGAGEDGAALITALIFLLLLTALGLASVMTSSTEMLIARNDRLNKLALDYANAGTQAAMAQLDANQLGTNAKAKDALGVAPGPWAFSSSSTELGLTALTGGEMNFSGTIAYRTEDAIHWVGKGETPQLDRSVNGSNEVVGYSKSCGYTNSPVVKYDKSFPVFQITSRGWIGDSTNPDATATVVVDVSKNTINVDVRSPLDSVCVSGTGNTTIHGASSCGGVTDNKSPYTMECPTGSFGGSYGDDSGTTGLPGQHSVPHQTIEDRLGMSLDELRAMAQGAGTYYNRTGGAWSGTDPTTLIAADYFTGFDDIVFIDTDTQLQVTGGVNSGILIVNGDLSSVGNFTWDGLVYVTGNMTLGAGTATINGGLVVDGSAGTTLGGNLNINYDCDNLEAIAQKAFNTVLLNWQRKFN